MINNRGIANSGIKKLRNFANWGIEELKTIEELKAIEELRIGGLAVNS